MEITVGTIDYGIASKATLLYAKLSLPLRLDPVFRQLGFRMMAFRSMLKLILMPTRHRNYSNNVPALSSVVHSRWRWIAFSPYGEKSSALLATEVLGRK